MAYEHHVFLSYRRFGEWPRWVEEKFLPLFRHWLGEELGSDIQIFFDKEMETGVAWPQKLAHALARSHVLVPLWSRQYFNSPWCKAELSHMLEREKKYGFGTVEHPEGLIIPALIHDGEDLPRYVSDRIPARLQNYTNVRMAKDSPTEEELSRAIYKWVPDVAKAIQCAPSYDPSWDQLAVHTFLAQLNAPRPRQEVPPSLGAL